MRHVITRISDARRWRAPACYGIALLLLLLFYVRNAHTRLDFDELAWLNGHAVAVFDQYRVAPRAFFILLHWLFGPSRIAAASLILLFHVFNAFLVHRLGWKLLGNGTVCRVATLVFLLNPITLSTLTWLACFSYVLGTTLTLLSLLAFLAGAERARAAGWSALAVLCYGVGLFSSHEMLLLPAIFPLLGWWRGGAAARRGWGVCGIAALLGLLVNSGFYHFDRYGIDVTPLRSLDFVSALLSSAVSFGGLLCLAYPLSYFVKAVDILPVCFSEPVRWAMTLLLLGAGAWWGIPTGAWRLRSLLLLAGVPLLIPYIIRLYLTPLDADFTPAYLLAGRVFYLPFAILALVLAEAGVAIFARLPRRWAWLPSAFALVAYLYALVFVYSPSDFLGMNMVPGGQGQPSSIAPYGHAHLLWLAAGVPALGMAVLIRTVMRQARASRSRDISYKCE